MFNIYICKVQTRQKEKKMKDMPQRPMSKNCKNKFNVKREKMAKDYFMQQSLPNGS